MQRMKAQEKKTISTIEKQIDISPHRDLPTSIRLNSPDNDKERDYQNFLHY